MNKHIEALRLIADLAEGSTTANSLPNIAKIARKALAASKSAENRGICSACDGSGFDDATGLHACFKCDGEGAENRGDAEQIVSNWIKSRGTSMNGEAYAAAVELVTFAQSAK